MAVQSRPLNTDYRQPQRRPLVLAVYALTLLLAILAAYALIGLAVGRINVALDDLRYGRPRTAHVSGFVGHGEESGMPTHLTAINLDRQIIVIELPGGDPSAARAIAGPYLFGADEHLTPATLSLRDMDGDGAVDLLLTVRREHIVYLNKEGAFRLPTAAEQAALSRVQE